MLPFNKQCPLGFIIIICG